MTHSPAPPAVVGAASRGESISRSDRDRMGTGAGTSTGGPVPDDDGTALVSGIAAEMFTGPLGSDATRGRHSRARGLVFARVGLMRPLTSSPDRKP